MSPTDGRPRVAIVGGGISGLAAAHRLQELAQEQRRPLAVHLLEAGDRLGGVVATERRDGFLLEAGPDSFITDKPWALDLCRRLGLTDRLIGTNATYRRSYVTRAGRLYPVPEGFQLLAPSRLGPFLASGLFSWPGKLRMALEPFVPARPSGEDESLAEFVERRLGREALTRIAQPMVAGIYGADPRRLSLQATLPRFLKMEQEHGSLLRAMWAQARSASSSRLSALGSRPGRTNAGGEPERSHAGVSGARYGLFVAFDAGMQTLVDAVVARLPAGCVSLGTRVTGLRREQANWQLITIPAASPVGAPLVGALSATYDAVCLALPAHRTAELLADVDAGLAEQLRAIPYGSAATVNLAYRREDVPHPLDGFGFVVPSAEGRSLLGCTFSSVKFAGRAPEGHALLRAFLGGSPSPEDAAVTAAVREDLRVLLGITAAPHLVTIHRWAASMAHYTVGHLARVAAIEERTCRWPGLVLAGNGYRGIGIPDCVHSGEQAAEQIWEALFPPAVN
jgi:oxygen-dependent protoporphyrinogen oxidase